VHRQTNVVVMSNSCQKIVGARRQRTPTEVRHKRGDPYVEIDWRPAAFLRIAATCTFGGASYLQVPEKKFVLQF
jgi:hypothetical protein